MTRNANAAMLDDVEAYYAERDGAGDELPTAWTPEHVMARMVEAFEILFRAGGTVGPKEFGSNWPGIVREFSELVDAQAYAEHQREGGKLKLRPTVDDISRMEEALAWPVLYLSDTPIASDALNLWAACKARGTSIKEVLRLRNQEAVRVATLREKDENAKRDAERRAVAKEVATWANGRIKVSDGTAGARARIMANAQIRLERELTAKGILAAQVFVKPSTVMPDKVLSQTSMDRHRYVAAVTISGQLQAMRVTVR